MDEQANYLAAFTVENPTDREAFGARWQRIMDNDAILKMAILHETKVVGHIASFERFGERELTYWLGRSNWGRGLATTAVCDFLRLERTRPLWARVANDNAGSVRVLEKNGFVKTGTETAFAQARKTEIEEFIFQLINPIE